MFHDGYMSGVTNIWVVFKPINLKENICVRSINIKRSLSTEPQGSWGGTSKGDWAGSDTKTSGYLEDCVVLETEERKCIRKMRVIVQVNQVLGFEHWI